MHPLPPISQLVSILQQLRLYKILFYRISLYRFLSLIMTGKGEKNPDPKRSTTYIFALMQYYVSESEISFHTAGNFLFSSLSKTQNRDGKLN